MTDKKTRSISKNLTTSLVLIIAAISLVFISIYYYQVSKRENKRLENTADEYINSLASTLEVPLWDIDRENITTVCNYYIQNDLARLIKLTGISGETFYLNKLGDDINQETLINRSTDIFHKGEQLGSLQVSLSADRSKEVKKELLKASITAVLIVVAGLVFFTGFLLKKMLHEPMRLLGRMANEYSKGNYHPQLMEKPYKEFEPFVSVLYDMGDTIESQMNDLQHAEISLKRHRDDLEKIVIQRTQELEISNQDLQNEIKYRKGAQEKLTANEQRLKAILRASPVGIGLVINRRLDWANATMYQMVGYDEGSLMGVDARILYKDEKAYHQAGQMLNIGIAQSDFGYVETQWMRKDGSAFDCIIRACSLDVVEPSKGQIVAVLDISEAKRLEERLQRAEKMEAIGTLAGGVAHDLNNILSGIVSYPEVLLLDIPDDSPIKQPLTTIQKSGEKAVEIVQDLLTMARRGVSITEVVNLNHIVTEQLQSPEMLKLKSFHPGVKLAPDLEPDLLNIKGSATHLSKSIMNLISNAAEAIYEKGDVVICTRNVYLDNPVRGYEHIEEGDYVKFSISDSGIGLAKNDIDNIFEPFYTKKKMGRSGTGLGMAVVWGTVKDHKGYIDITSASGKGSTFSLYFPVTREQPASDATDDSVWDYCGKQEIILIVDDMAEQREIATVILQKLGYSVFSVKSGEEAIEYLKDNSADLIILDMIMAPGMDGFDTYRHIIKYNPGQKAIIASGFSKTERVKALQKLGAGQYIRKPYTLTNIARAVKEELDKT